MKNNKQINKEYEKSKCCGAIPNNNFGLKKTCFACDKPFISQEKGETHCQCKECKIKLHFSDCAVHNEPAERNGKCTCPLKNKEVANWEEFKQDWRNLLDDNRYQRVEKIAEIIAKKVSSLISEAKKEERDEIRQIISNKKKLLWNDDQNRYLENVARHNLIDDILQSLQ